MKNKVFIPVFSAMILLLFSCNVQNIEKYNEDFKGEWRTDVYFSPSKGDSAQSYLTVDGKNSGFGVACDKDDPFEGCLFFQTGKIKYNKASKGIQFGNSVSQIHTVTEDPFINEYGQWELSIDSLSYFKY